MAKKEKKNRVSVTATIAGKRKYFYGKTHKDAEKKRDLYLYELDNPTINLSRAAKEWEDAHIPEVAYRTWLGYQGHLNSIIAEFGELNIKDISHIDIEGTLRTMATQKYSYKTVKAKYSVWNMIFKHALYSGYVDSNPCERVRIPKGLSKGRRELPEQAEIEKVNNGLDCHFGVFAYFLLLTGLRRGEALAIRWEDIDFERNSIYVVKAVFFKNNKPQIKTTKTENGIRTVPLLAPLKTVLNAIPIKDGYLFGENSLMTEQAFRCAWERYSKESGVKITPHQLRHAFATFLFDAEISSKSAQKILGHADYKTTMEIYTHISASRDEVDTKKINDFIKNL